MDLIDFDKIYQSFITNNKDFEICKNVLDILNSKDSITYNHCYRVGCMAGNFSMFLQYPEEYCKKVFNAAIMHDIGKLKINDNIMRKPGKSLTKEERKILVAHPLYGVEVLKELNLYLKLDYIVPLIALHHESPLDGKGLFKIDVKNIADYIFITKICDCFDAIRVSRRPDETNKTLEETLNILNHQCYYNLTQEWIDKFNQYINYIL